MCNDSRWTQRSPLIPEVASKEGGALLRNHAAAMAEYHKLRIRHADLAECVEEYAQ